VVLDEGGKAQFNPLMFNRAQPIFAAFDVLYLNGKDVRDLELIERKAKLRELVRPDAGALYVGHIVEKGKALYKQVCAKDVEGVVAKPIISPYREVKGRSPWLKIRNPDYSQKEGRTDLFNRKRGP
jgi:bifunctional non-homologous end joining protein LigD